MKQGSIVFLRIAVFIIGIVMLILCVFTLPMLARNAANMNPDLAYLQHPVLFGLYLTAIPFFFALYQALKLLKYIEINETFSELAVRSLGLIKHCATTIIMIYLIGLVLLGIAWYSKCFTPWYCDDRFCNTIRNLDYFNLYCCSSRAIKKCPKNKTRKRFNSLR